MNNFKTLLKLNIKQYFGMPKDPQLRKKKIIAEVIIAVCFIPIIALLCAGIYFMSGAMNEYNVLDSLLSSSMLAAQVMVFFFGIVSFLSIMFFSKDNEFLLTLPVKPVHIYLSKLFVVYLSHLLLSTLLLAPILIMTAISVKITSVMYYVLLPFAILLVPLIPLLIISLFALPIAYLVNFFRRNNLFATIFGIVGMVIFFGLYFFGIMSVQSSVGEGNMNMEAIGNVLKIVSLIGYPNLVLSRAMLGVGNIAANTAIFFAIILVVGALAIVLSILLYRKCATKFLETGTTSGKAKKLKASGSQLKSLIIRDVKMLTRESSLAINSLMGLILTPLIIGIMSFSIPSFTGAEVSLPKIGMDLSKMSMGLFMSTMMLIGTNYLAILAISREGDKFYMLKYMPINTKTLIKSKLILADIYVITGAFICSIIFLVAKIHIINVLAYFIGISLIGMGMNGFCVGRDIKKPKLDWMNAKQLLKNNTTTLIPILMSMLIGIVMLISSILLSSFSVKLGIWSGVINWVIYLLVGIVLYIVFRLRVYDIAEKHFNNIEAYNS